MRSGDVEFVEIGKHSYKNLWKFPATKKCPNRKCGKIFSTRKTAMKHYQNIHAKSAMLCEICDIPISNAYFKTHFRQIHPDDTLPEPFFNGIVQEHHQLSHSPHPPHPTGSSPTPGFAVVKLDYDLSEDSSEDSIDDSSNDSNKDSRHQKYENDNSESDESHIPPTKRTHRGMEETNGPKRSSGRVLDMGDVMKIVVDVNQFEQLDCKVEGQCIEVEAGHAGKNQNINVIQRVSYRYEIPYKFESRDVTANFSSDGILTVNIPKEMVNKVHHVPIEQTGPVRKTELQRKRRNSASTGKNDRTDS